MGRHYAKLVERNFLLNQQKDVLNQDIKLSTIRTL